MAGAKRRNPVKGPLVTFALMLGSIAVVATVASLVESKEKSAEASAPVVANETSHAISRQ